MVSKETESRIIKIFLCLADYEKKIDILRNILCTQNDFDARNIFSRLDILEKGYLDEKDFKDFLKYSLLIQDYILFL
jgi:hypothetical protein